MLKKSFLESAYDVATFRSQAHEIVDLLSNHLERHMHDADTKAIAYKNPDTTLEDWKGILEEKMSTSELMQRVLDSSIAVHNPGYMGHQVSTPNIYSLLPSMVVDLLNNGAAVYEMGMASNAMEKIVTDKVCELLGFEDGGGFLTSGGTLANLTALLAARKSKVPEVWENGSEAALAVLVSEEAHYCVDRAARIMGLGSKGIIKVKSDANFCIDLDDLKVAHEKALAEGLFVFALVGCAGSTATGSYDDLEALADFAENENLWFHVDGAHGAAVVFSETHKDLAKGIHRADSVVLDFHKMLATHALCTALVFREKMQSYHIFASEAHYLWEEQESEEWYHSGKRTFECTKHIMALRVFAIWHQLGLEYFGWHVDRLHEMTQSFAKLIQGNPAFELLVEPQSNILNFKLLNGESDVTSIRQKLMEEGNFYIVQSTIRGKKYFRTTIMNPWITEEHFERLLERITEIAFV